jgi:hypothetical protein
MLTLEENLIKCEKDNRSKKTRSEGRSLAKLKLFHLTPKEKPQINEPPIQKEIEKSQKRPTIPKTTQEHPQTPIKEYNETLYSKDLTQKKPATLSSQEKQQIRRTTWENTETIERNVDNLDINQTESVSSRVQKGVDTEKKVDFILLKKKK